MCKQLTALVRVSLLLIALRLAADEQRSPADDASPLFDTQKVHFLNLTVSAANWAAIQQSGSQASPRPGGPGLSASPDGFAYVRADLEFQGATLNDIGLRLKGNSSFRASVGSLKRPFKLDFNQFVKGQKFMGLTSLHLNINAMDPSAMRESLAYSLFRQAGIPSSRTAYARVYLTVPGKYDRQYLGLYTLIEDVNKTFATARFGTSKGLLVKARRGENLPYLGEQWQEYSRCYETKIEGDATLQKRFIEFLQLVHRADEDTFRTQIASYMDVDEFLRFIAVNALLSNMDSFLCTGQNYCLYLHPETRKVVWIPWDLNEAFAGFMPAGSPEQQINLSIDHPYAGANRLIERVLAIPEHQRAYRDCIAQLMGTSFKAESFQAAMAATQRLIADAQADEQKAYAQLHGPGGPAGVVWDGPRQQRPSLDVFANKRTASITEQLAGRSNGQILRGLGPRGGPGGPGEPNGRWPPPPNPLMQALDTNRDGELSAEEIANAPASLKKLGGNRDDRTDRNEVRPR